MWSNNQQQNSPQQQQLTNPQIICARTLYKAYLILSACLPNLDIFNKKVKVNAIAFNNVNKIQFEIITGVPYQAEQSLSFQLMVKKVIAKELPALFKSAAVSSFNNPPPNNIFMQNEQNNNNDMGLLPLDISEASLLVFAQLQLVEGKLLHEQYVQGIAQLFRQECLQINLDQLKSYIQKSGEYRLSGFSYYQNDPDKGILGILSYQDIQDVGQDIIPKICAIVDECKKNNCLFRELPGPQSDQQEAELILHKFK